MTHFSKDQIFHLLECPDAQLVKEKIRVWISVQIK